jgi:YVTN family beta-propeller protein
MMKLAKTILALSISAACAHAAAILPVETTVPVGSGTHAVATDPLLHRAFVSNRDSGTVSFIDLIGNSAIGSFAAGTNPASLLSDAATSRVYVLNDASPGTLTVLNGATAEVIARVQLGDRPQSMAADFQRGQVYVSNAGASSVSIVDVGTNRVLATLPVGRIPQGIAVDAARGRIYVSNTADGTLTVIDRDTLAAIATIAVGHNPGVPAIDERTGRVFVNAVDDRAVFVVDPAALAVIGVVPSGSAAADGALSAVYRRLYLSVADDHTVVAIDLDALAVAGTFAVGRLPQKAVVDADAGAIYVANQADASVSVIDPQRNVVAAGFAAAAGASELAIAASPDRLLVVSDGDGSSDKSTFVPKLGLVADTAIAVEYAATFAEQYFHTADATERRLLDDGILGTAWQKTENYWRVWTVPASNRIPVCRFASYSSTSGASQIHAYGSECAALKATLGADYEMVAYYVAMPASDGSCPSGTEALFRLASRDTADGVQRYRLTPDPAARDAMVAKGWVAEGFGAARTFACTPSLRASFTELPAPPDIGLPPLPGRTPWPIAPRPRPKDADDPAVDGGSHDRFLPVLHMNQR